MTAISISDRIHYAVSETKEQHTILTNAEQLLQVEQQLAKLEHGINAIAKKSFRSARFSLIKQLSAGKAANILSFQPAAAWHDDINIYHRLGATLFYASQFSEDEWMNALIYKNISLVYVSTIHSESLAIEDFSYIISKAHQLNIPVVFDNTAGGLGHIYSPLADGADFILTDVSASEPFKNNPINAFIVEGSKGVLRNNAKVVAGSSVLDELKNKRVLAIKDTFIVAREEGFVDKILAKEARKHGDYSRTANYLARWLYTQYAIAEINYAGLKSAESHIHAEMYFKGGYGSVLKFSLWDNEYSYSLLKGYLRSGKPKGIAVHTNNDTKEFYVELKTEHYAHVLQYFQNIFANLKQNVEFRQHLAKEHQLKNVFDSALTQLITAPQYKRFN